MATTVYLAPGDQTLAGAIELTDNQNYILLGLKIPPPAAGKDGRIDNLPFSARRTVTLDVGCFDAIGRQSDVAMAAKRAIEKLLERARRAQADGPDQQGSRVVLWLKHTNGAKFVYLDVENGIVENLWEDHGADPFIHVKVTLTCLPYARGEPVTVGPFAVQPGSNNAATVGNVPGDAGAWCQTQISDMSPVGVINTVRMGRRSGHHVQSGDWLGLVNLSAALGSAAGVADATCLGGERIQLTTNAGFQDFAANGGTGQPAQHGRFHIFLRGLDPTTTLGSPTNLSAVPNYLAAGVAPGSYQFQVTELDVSSNETAPSAPVAVAPSASCQIALTWTVVGSPTNQRVYCVDYLSGVPRYTYVATGSTAGSYTVTAIPFGTTGTPPVNAAAAMQPAYILPFSAIAGAAQYVQGQAQQFQVANNIWEHLYLGVFDLPPIPQLDSQANNNAGWLNWVLKLQARSGTNAAVISADYLALFPEEEPFLTARFSPNNLATRRNWIIETRRDGANAAYLTSQADGTVQGQCRVDGAFWLGPGYNVVQFLFDMAGGFADYGNAQVNVTFRYMPRYYDLGGVVGMP